MSLDPIAPTERAQNYLTRKYRLLSPNLPTNPRKIHPCRYDSLQHPLESWSFYFFTAILCSSLSLTQLVCLALEFFIVKVPKLINSTSTVIPVFYFTDIELGGYGFTPLQISLFMALGGISQAVWLLLIFPPLQHRFGTGGVLRGCAVVWPIFFFAAAAGNLFLRQDWTLAFWIVAPISMVIGSGVAMAFSEFATIVLWRTSY